MARPKKNTDTSTTMVTTPTNKKKLSLNEFRAWLSGIQEMQPPDWSPDANQWKIIRTKIEEVVDVPPIQQPRRFVTEYGDDESAAQSVRPAAPSAFPAAPPVILPPTPAPVPGADGKIRTPTIDTSDKPYESSFG